MGDLLAGLEFMMVKLLEWSVFEMVRDYIVVLYCEGFSLYLRFVQTRVLKTQIILWLLWRIPSPSTIQIKVRSRVDTILG